MYDNISGFLLVDLSGNPGNLTLLNIVGSLTMDIVGMPGSEATFNITSGSFAQQPNGFVDGELNYILTGGPSAGSGTFYFDAINFMNNSTGPNRFSETSLVVWANNWNKEGNESRPSYGALGVDLKGSIRAVPEPTTLLLIGTGFAGLIGWRYLKSQG
ncbi:MAG: PEP-CTERM sorting domain-containing protein [Nitrospirae bacterium]|nr:PEP-CTERM sorting domain-containing protein [Nitrospirota bacterium]